MTKLAKMSLIGSILSLTGCRILDVQLKPFPNQHLYVTDIQNKVCAEYALADTTNITFTWVADHPLVARGPCDRMAGYTTTGFKLIQNWVRDGIKAVQNQNN